MKACKHCWRVNLQDAKKCVGCGATEFLDIIEIEKIKQESAREEPEWEKTYRVERAARDKAVASKFTEDGHRKYDR